METEQIGIVMFSSISSISATSDPTGAGLLRKAPQQTLEVLVLKQAFSQFRSLVPFLGKFSQRHLSPQFIIF